MNALALRALLTLRNHREQIEERSLARVSAERGQLNAILIRLASQIRDQNDSRSQQGSVARPALEHIAADAHVRALYFARAEVQEKLAALDERYRDQLRRYTEAHRNHEIIAHLMEEQFQQLKVDAERKDQRQQADLLNARRIILRTATDA